VADKEGAVVVVASATGLFNHGETINEHPLKVIIIRARATRVNRILVSNGITSLNVTRPDNRVSRVIR
jgi:hypothetical protein